MRNTIRTALFTLSTAILLVVLVTSCMSLSHNLRYTVPQKRTTAPVDAFVLVEVEEEMIPATCVSSSPGIDCDRLLKELPTSTKSWSGSGLMVMSDTGPSILTAAHVCEKDTPDSFVYKEVKITILTAIRIRVHSPLKGTYNASIMRTDVEKDLCLLRPETIFTYPVTISQKSPQIGDKVYAISAPYGISGKNLALVFNGFFSGSGEDMKFYTIPTRPGSSGSVVMNEDWEVIGVLHTAFRDLENVGMGTGLSDVTSFLFSPVETIVVKPLIQP